MCRICRDGNIFLNHPNESIRVSDKHELLDIIREIKNDHPWYYMVGPMSDAERAWYDLDSPSRKK